MEFDGECVCRCVELIESRPPDNPDIRERYQYESHVSRSENARAFNQDISGWDVSNVTNMQSMFNGASAFNQDIGDWGVISVTNMRSMFRNTLAFNQDIGDWDVNSVTDMRRMFKDAANFNQDIGGWDVSNVTNMIGMFENTLAFDQDIGGWDVGMVADMTDTFLNARLSNHNYDALLIGWSAIDADESRLQAGVSFHAGDAQYCVGTDARTILTDTHNWDITDGGRAANCSDDATLTALSITPGSLNETFHEDTLTYTATVGNSVGSLTVTPTAANAAAVIVITVNGTDLSTGTATDDINLDIGDNTITIAVTAQDRTRQTDYTITITRADANPTDFVTTWRTSSDAQIITIPIFAGETYDYTVDWGDGDVSANQTGDARHTYTSAGEYAVRISGRFPRIYINNDSQSRGAILSVDQWGRQAWTSMEICLLRRGESNRFGNRSPRINERYQYAEHV